MDRNDKRNQSGGSIPEGTHEPTKILGTTGLVHRVKDRVLPLTAFYVTPADTLLLNVTPDGIAAQLFLNYRLMLPDGTIQTAQEIMQVTAGFTEQTKSIALIEGWLLSVTVECNTGQVPVGNLYTQVFLIRGAFGNLVWPTLLLADYANSFYHLGWPGSPVNQPVTGRGWARTQNGPSVGAGVQISLQLDIHHRFAIDSVSAILTTGVAVANRLVIASLFDGTQTYLIAPSNVTQTASTAFTYFWGKGLQYATVNVNQIVAPWVLDQESACDHPVQVNVNAFGLQAADQFSALFVRTRQWQESD